MAQLCFNSVIASMVLHSFAFLLVECSDVSPLQIIARLRAPNPDPSGIAVTSDNRIFLGFPRILVNHDSFGLAELVNGSLVPFPNAAYVFPPQSNNGVAYCDWLVSPHGMYMDQDDVLWIIDSGKRAGIKAIPVDAAKVVGIDIKSRQIVASIVITRDAMSDDSHLNDIRVDRKGFAYVSNSGFGPRYSIVVVNIATGKNGSHSFVRWWMNEWMNTCGLPRSTFVAGKSREVLLNHQYTSPEAGFMGFLEGVPLVYYSLNHHTFLADGPNGIGISSDGRTLYWTALTSRKLYSIATDVLRNFASSNHDIEQAVRYEGEHPVCDGLAEDEAGNIYFGAMEQGSLVKRSPRGDYQLLAHDADHLTWPDGLAYRNGYLYVTLHKYKRTRTPDSQPYDYLIVRTRV